MRVSEPLNVTPGELAETAVDPEVSRSVRLTLLTSMGATVVMALAAIPFAWVLARKDFPLKQLVNAIVDVPIVIPHSAAGIALLLGVGGAHCHAARGAPH